METRPQLYCVKIGEVTVALHNVPMVEVADASRPDA